MADNTNTDSDQYDFFKIYDLPKYSADSPSYYGFMPITISLADADDESKAAIGSEGEDTGNIVAAATHLGGVVTPITLPWKVGEISDEVSVSFARRGQNQTENVLYNAAAQLVQNMMNSSTISDIIMAKYDPTSLTKTLTLDFILPLHITKTTNIGTIGSVRRALGTLQGLLYPRGYGFAYPPLLKVSLNAIYKGFKGYLNGVSIRQSEEQVAVGGQMFPLVITGTLKFINLFLYSWYQGGKLSSFISNGILLDLQSGAEILFGDRNSDDDNVAYKNEYPPAGNALPKVNNNIPPYTTIKPAPPAQTASPVPNTEGYTAAGENPAFVNGEDITTDEYQQQFTGSSGFTDDLTNKTKDTLGQTFSKAIDSAGNALENSARNILKSIANAPIRILNNTINNVTNVLTNVDILHLNSSTLKSSLSSAVKNAALNTISTSVGDIESSVNNVATSVLTIPTKMLTGAVGIAADAITKETDKVINTVLPPTKEYIEQQRNIKADAIYDRQQMDGR